MGLPLAILPREIEIDIITTARLNIRRFKETDLGEFLAYQSRPEVRQFMPGQAMNEDQAERFLLSQSSMQDCDRDAYHAFAVTLRDCLKLIGDVGMYLPSGEKRVGDLGFQFHPGFLGQGYALEAAEALVKHAFSEWMLEKVTANCDAENTRSYRLMERLGMSRVEQAEMAGSYTYQLLRTSFISQA